MLQDSGRVAQGPPQRRCLVPRSTRLLKSAVCPSGGTPPYPVLWRRGRGRGRGRGCLVQRAAFVYGTNTKSLTICQKTLILQCYAVLFALSSTSFHLPKAKCHTQHGNAAKYPALKKVSNAPNSAFYTPTSVGAGGSNTTASHRLVFQPLSPLPSPPQPTQTPPA